MLPGGLHAPVPEWSPGGSYGLSKSHPCSWTCAGPLRVPDDGSAYGTPRLRCFSLRWKRFGRQYGAASQPNGRHSVRGSASHHRRSTPRKSPTVVRPGGEVLTKAATKPQAKSVRTIRSGCRRYLRAESACRPPRSFMSFRKCAPLLRSVCTVASRSETSIVNRFQPPGCGSAPSDMA
jgi:hypothetical protein